MGKEIERKFLVKEIPANLNEYPYHMLEQGYLNTDPVVRVRKEDDTYYLTYKGRGYIEKEEYNLPLNEEAYRHLVAKADGNIISKKRHLIPCPPYTIELDVFEAPFQQSHTMHILQGSSLWNLPKGRLAISLISIV